MEKKDFGSDSSLMLQFVDMQIYALSRFISPEGENGNVLVNMEKVYGDIESGDKSEEELKESFSDFLRTFCEIYDHLRFKVAKNHLTKQGCYSSLVSVGKNGKFNENYGAEFDRKAWGFCNGIEKVLS